MMKSILCISLIIIFGMTGCRDLDKPETDESTVSEQPREDSQYGIHNPFRLIDETQLYNGISKDMVPFVCGQPL
ncbi:MAG: hypothetical protein ABFR50_06735 [Candidatus Fermentibacteria bacterium]